MQVPTDTCISRQLAFTQSCNDDDAALLQLKYGIRTAFPHLRVCDIPPTSITGYISSKVATLKKLSLQVNDKINGKNVYKLSSERGEGRDGSGIVYKSLAGMQLRETWSVLDIIAILITYDIVGNIRDSVFVDLVWRQIVKQQKQTAENEQHMDLSVDATCMDDEGTLGGLPGVPECRTKHFSRHLGRLAYIIFKMWSQSDDQRRPPSYVGQFDIANKRQYEATFNGRISDLNLEEYVGNYELERHERDRELFRAIDATAPITPAKFDQDMEVEPFAATFKAVKDQLVYMSCFFNLHRSVTPHSIFIRLETPRVIPHNAFWVYSGYLPEAVNDEPASLGYCSALGMGCLSIPTVHPCKHDIETALGMAIQRSLRYIYNPTYLPTGDVTLPPLQRYDIVEQMVQMMNLDIEIDRPDMVYTRLLRADPADLVQLGSVALTEQPWYPFWLTSSNSDYLQDCLDTVYSEAVPTDGLDIAPNQYMAIALRGMCPFPYRGAYTKSKHAVTANPKQELLYVNVPDYNRLLDDARQNKNVGERFIQYCMIELLYLLLNGNQYQHSVSPPEILFQISTIYDGGSKILTEDIDCDLLFTESTDPTVFERKLHAKYMCHAVIRICKQLEGEFTLIDMVNMLVRNLSGEVIMFDKLHMMGLMVTMQAIEHYHQEHSISYPVSTLSDHGMIRPNPDPVDLYRTRITMNTSTKADSKFWKSLVGQDTPFKFFNTPPADRISILGFEGITNVIAMKPTGIAYNADGSVERSLLPGFVLCVVAGTSTFLPVTCLDFYSRNTADNNRYDCVDQLPVLEELVRQLDGAIKAAAQTPPVDMVRLLEGMKTSPPVVRAQLETQLRASQAKYEDAMALLRNAKWLLELLDQIVNNKLGVTADGVLVEPGTLKSFGRPIPCSVKNIRNLPYKISPYCGVMCIFKESESQTVPFGGIVLAMIADKLMVAKPNRTSSTTTEFTFHMVDPGLVYI